MSWLINLSGLALMALIVWWFWLAGAGKARRATHGAVDIIVDDGVYEPAVIESNAGEPLSLRFERQPLRRTGGVPRPRRQRVFTGGGNHHGNADAGTTGHLPFYLPDEYVPGQTDRSLTRG